VNANERDEITASVAAHAELGHGYDSAVAEGLVERIGEEIDRRIDTRFGPQAGRPAASQPPAYYGPAQTPAMTVAAPAAVAPRHGNGWTGVVLGLGSMGLGVGATAVVVSNHVNSAAALLMVFLIWMVIGAINFGHSQRR
jgi:predicted small metal-binding protein